MLTIRQIYARSLFIQEPSSLSYIFLSFWNFWHFACFSTYLPEPLILECSLSRGFKYHLSVFLFCLSSPDADWWRTYFTVTWRSLRDVTAQNAGSSGMVSSSRHKTPDLPAWFPHLIPSMSQITSSNVMLELFTFKISVGKKPKVLQNRNTQACATWPEI